jgi:FAD-dependent urate hydroxylase
MVTPAFTVRPFPLNWLVTTPALMHLMPADLRNRISTRCLRPAATAWLRPRWAGIGMTGGSTVHDVEPKGDRISLRLDNGAELSVDHVLVATGYRIDLAKYRILAPELLGRIDSAGGHPVLSAGFESSMPGLHFLGLSAVASFGPLMRFVAGAGFAARVLTQAVVASSR